MDIIPTWAFFVGTVFFVMASIEAGYQFGSAALRRSTDEKESPVSSIAAAVLGLVAFILAFTFGIVSDRYDARRGLVRDEANAIRTAYLRSDFLPEPDRAEAKGLLKEYLEARLTLAQFGNFAQERVDEHSAVVKRAQGCLWNMAVVNARKDMNSDVAALYIESLNDVFAIHALRVAVGFQARVPPGIWGVLFALTILGMAGVGYHTGIAGSKRSMARPILAVAFALVIVLIASLDRPGGFVKVTQQPLIDLQSWMSKDVAGAGHSAATSPIPGPSANGPTISSRN